MLRPSITLAAIFFISSLVSAAGPTIGSVVSEGDVQIDHHPVTTGSTLFDGSLLETGDSPLSVADVRVGGNIQLTLLGNSRGTLFRDHFVLLRGQVQIAALDSFRIDAASLSVSAYSAHAAGLVTLGRDGSMTVSAREGSVQVRNQNGLILAQLHSGKPSAFFRATGGDWQVRDGSVQRFDGGPGDRPNCYLVDADDRDCDRHHHHHPSR